jgi:glycerol-3-phosphate acyltransferase PlsY
MTLLTALTLAYFLGSVPFGLLLVRMAGLGDIRESGSGNIGATNVMRSGNKKLGIATLLLDMGKGVLAVVIARHIGLEQPWLYVATFAAVLGHVFPLWLKFKGGKGVATAFGVLWALSPLSGMVFSIGWLIDFAFVRIVSVASITAIWLVVPFNLNHLHDLAFHLALALLITWTHRGNLARLRAGTEPSLRKKQP